MKQFNLSSPLRNKHSSCKPRLLLTLALVFPIAAFAQGTLDFKNFGSPNVNAPVFLPDGVRRLSGEEFVAFLYAGPTRPTWP